ncbi:MAG: pilus assembly protein CpaE [Propionibacteriaceae bacterium]
MISLDLAGRLSHLLTWTPQNSDRFFIARDEMRDSVFTVSDMVVEQVTNHGQTRFHFNGTTEWALDSIDQDEAVWLPREDQLRELLEDSFLSLDRQSGHFVVSVLGPEGAFHTDPVEDASDAYAHALLHVLEAATADSAA